MNRVWLPILAAWLLSACSAPAELPEERPKTPKNEVVLSGTVTYEEWRDEQVDLSINILGHTLGAPSKVRFVQRSSMAVINDKLYKEGDTLEGERVRIRKIFPNRVEVEPIPPVEEKPCQEDIQSLLRKLDSDDPIEREQATLQLTELGERAVDSLRKEVGTAKGAGVLEGELAAPPVALGVVRQLGVLLEELDHGVVALLDLELEPYAVHLLLRDLDPRRQPPAVVAPPAQSAATSAAIRRSARLPYWITAA